VSAVCGEVLTAELIRAAADALDDCPRAVALML
jgi:hypothetical protein